MGKRILALQLAAMSFAFSQGSEAKAVLTYVYGGHDFRNYCLDPPFWSYSAKGEWHSRSVHWLYRNHRDVFIDIKISK